MVRPIKSCTTGCAWWCGLGHSVFGLSRTPSAPFLTLTHPPRFAYRPNWSTGNAVPHILHATLTTDNNKGNYVRMLFIDYSSTFNTKSPTGWSPNSGTSVPGFWTFFNVVRVRQTTSNIITLSTGVLCFTPDDTVVIIFNNEAAYVEEVENECLWMSAKPRSWLWPSGGGSSGFTLCTSLRIWPGWGFRKYRYIMKKFFFYCDLF